MDLKRNGVDLVVPVTQPPVVERQGPVSRKILQRLRSYRPSSRKELLLLGLLKILISLLVGVVGWLSLVDGFECSVQNVFKGRVVVLFKRLEWIRAPSVWLGRLRMQFLT